MCKNFRSLLDMSVLSLSKQSGLVALESLHQSCLQLESNYMKSWLPTLSNKNLLEEEQLDCLNLNLESIVTDYESKQRKRKRRVVKRVEGIPVGSSAKDYITYRKCHYLYTINKWRQSLMTLITWDFLVPSPPCINQRSGSLCAFVGSALASNSCIICSPTIFTTSN